MYEQSASPNDKIKKALLLVVRRHLTAPPSSTNVERLFSCGGLVATDHPASLAPEKLDQVLFLTAVECACEHNVIQVFPEEIINMKVALFGFYMLLGLT